jgi:hypothetical protein
MGSPIKIPIKGFFLPCLKNISNFFQIFLKKCPPAVKSGGYIEEYLLRFLKMAGKLSNTLKEVLKSLKL